MILVKTDHHYLRVGCHSWYQSITGVIHRVRSYFQKPTVRICLDAHIRSIVVLIDSKLTVIYFMYLLYVIYYSVTMHLRQVKKVSILLSGELNPGPVPSRRGLLEDSPYRAVEAACLSCNWTRPRI
jgi:hypothetical protein